MFPDHKSRFIWMTVISESVQEAGSRVRGSNIHNRIPGEGHQLHQETLGFPRSLGSVMFYGENRAQVT